MPGITRIEQTVPIIIVRFSAAQACPDVSREIYQAFTEIDATIGNDCKVIVMSVITGLPPSSTTLLDGLDAAREKLPGSPHDERILCNILVSSSVFWKTVVDATSMGIFRGLNLKFFYSEEEAFNWIENQVNLLIASPCVFQAL